jgi:hypothetical protein
MKLTEGRKWAQSAKAIAVALFACSVLASCASLVGVRHVELPLTRLQEGLDRRFPIDNRILTMLDIRLTRPKLMVLPNNDRIALTMDATLAPPFIGYSWNGSFALSGRLIVDAARNAVFISDARVERFALDGIDVARQRQFAEVANLVSDTIIKDMPLYRFRPEDLRFAGVQFAPTRIVTAPGALVVTFEPVR